MRKMTDAVHLFSGQPMQMVIICKNLEDQLFLKERLKNIKNGKISSAQFLHQIDLEQEYFKLTRNHVIMFIDDAKSTQSSLLQKYRNLERLTIIYLNDAYSHQTGNHLLTGGSAYMRR
jgi:hypothetical protein